MELQHGMVVDGHLGGYIPGGDPATFYPALWEWLVQDLGVKSVVDIGCGDGVAVRWFAERLGSEAVLGLDGIPQDDARIMHVDFAERDPVADGSIRAHFDLAWSCEFLEHVEEQFLQNYMSVFRLASLVAVTHATPGQAGWHHVNCQPGAYWIERFADAGFTFLETATLIAREKASVNPDPNNHFARSGLLFLATGEVERWKRGDL